MQLVSCYVNLAGDLRHVVFKQSVSVAEVLVLRALHGQNAVTKIMPIGSASGHVIGNVAEKDRLTDIYGRKRDGIGRALIEKLFPGFNPRMPATLKDIGVSEFDDEQSPAAAAAGVLGVMSPPEAGGSPQLGQAGDAIDPGTNAQPASPDDAGEAEGDPPEVDYRTLPVEEAVDPGQLPRSGNRVPGLRVT